MTYLESIILGIVQGLTEFLPVSSSGHLVMLQNFMKLDPETDAMKIFDLAVHLGTMVAVLIYYRRSIGRYAVGLAQSIPTLSNPASAYRKTASVRFSVLATVAIVTTGLIYMLFGDYIEHGFENAKVVIGCWLVTAAILWLTDRQRGKNRISLKQFGIMAALIVGLAQGFALLPGISRSGSTICAAVLLGLHRRWAGEFSFLIGIPAIAGAALIKGIQFFSGPHEPFAWDSVIIGTIASGLTGFLALQLLIWAVRRAKLRVFSFYLVIISIASIIGMATGVIR